MPAIYRDLLIALAANHGGNYATAERIGRRAAVAWEAVESMLAELVQQGLVERFAYGFRLSVEGRRLVA